MDFGLSDVEVVERTTAFHGYLKVFRYRLKHRLFKGSWSSVMTREVMERDHAVVVLPYDPHEDNVVLLKQFRPGMFHDGQSPWSV